MLREIKINFYLDHPNIAKLYGCFSDTRNVYLVCEYATERNLFDLMSEPEPMEERKVSSVAGQICSALDCVHRQRMIHRDIKPENILLTMGGVVKICDFGWSVYNPQSILRSTFCGTPLYLAP